MKRIGLLVMLGLCVAGRARADEAPPPAAEDPGVVPTAPPPAPVPTPAPAPYYGRAPAYPPAAPMLIAAPAPRRHLTSITISPVHFILPVVEITGELRAARQLGVAAIVGVGRIKMGGQSFGAYEGGGQLVYYPIGSFDGGFELGGEALYVKVETSNLSSTTVSGQATGGALGPFAGYKYVAGMGFTFIGQLGVDFLTAKATASNGGSAGGKTVIPLVNLQVGWSF